jgi:hypothetical protein
MLERERERERERETEKEKKTREYLLLTDCSFDIRFIV